MGHEGAWLEVLQEGGEVCDPVSLAPELWGHSAVRWDTPVLCPAPPTHSLRSLWREMLSSFHWWGSRAQTDQVAYTKWWRQDLNPRLSGERTCCFLLSSTMSIFCLSCKMSLNVYALFFIFHTPSGLNSSTHTIDVICLGVQPASI